MAKIGRQASSGSGMTTDALKNIIGGDGQSSTTDIVDRVVARTQRRYDSVPLNRIYANRRQPREEEGFNEAELNELGDSIKEHGLIEPIVVRESKEQPGWFELACGERRWRAMCLKNIEKADAVILDAECSDEKMEQIALIENIQRKDLTPYETAKAYYRLWKDEQGNPLRTVTEVSKLVKKSEFVVDEYLAILRAPEEVRQLIIDDPSIPRRIIRDLGTIENPEDRAFLIDEVRGGALNANALTGLLRRSRQIQQKQAPVYTGRMEEEKPSAVQREHTTQESGQSPLSTQQDRKLAVASSSEAATPVMKKRTVSPALKLAALEQRLRKEGETIRKVTEKLTEELTEMSQEEKDAVRNSVGQWSTWVSQVLDLTHQER